MGGGMRWASMVLPQPGGPIMRMLCPPGASDFDGALCRLLSADVFEVDEELLGLAQKRIAVSL
jgi:hypothetical protein